MRTRQQPGSHSHHAEPSRGKSAPVSGHLSMLALQRAAGNSAVTALLAAATTGRAATGRADIDGSESITRGDATSRTGLASPTPQQFVVQRTKADAARYLYNNRDQEAIEEFLTRELRLPSGRHTQKIITNNLTKDDVDSFVTDTDMPEKHRRDLLDHWNRRQNKNNKIDIPVDLKSKITDLTTMETTSFENYDSDTEDRNMDVSASVAKAAKERATLVRQDGTTVPDVPVLTPADAWRFGRQVVKKSKVLDDYQRCLPFVTKVGGKWIEYNSPGTLDIYAFPLTENSTSEDEPATAPVPEKKRNREDADTSEPPEATSEFPESTSQDPVKEPPKKRPRLARTGNTKSDTWENIGKHLTADQSESSSFTDIKKRIFDAFHGNLPSEATKAEAVAIAAIGSDLMKGVAGGMHYVKKAKKSDPASFSELFGGSRPSYRPAADQGRAKVRKRHGRLKEAKVPTVETPQDTRVVVEEKAAPELVIPRDEVKPGDKS